MRKSFLLLLVLILLFSCSKKVTEVEVTQKAATTEKKSEVVSSAVADTKPLINIEKEDTLQIWARADGAPGMFINEAGELEGFYVELEKLVMKEMDQKYEFFSYTDLGPLIQKIKSGEAHSALAAFDVPDFRALAHLSDTYEDLEYVIFLRKDNSDIIPDLPEDAIKYLYGKKVGVQTRGHVWQLLRNHKEIEIVEYPTTTAALEALHNGDLDAVPDVNRIGKYYSKQNNWEIKGASKPVLSFKTVTGFSKALDPSVIERYNVALNTLIDKGEVEKLYNSFFGE